MRRRTSTRWGLVAGLAAVVACLVTPAATTANFTIVPGGSAVTVTVSTAGTTSTASFTGTAGQRVSLNMTGVTITSSHVSILKPGGTLVGPFTVTRAGRYLDVRTLPVSGTYKILVDPKLDYTGRMVLRLYNVPPDPTGAATLDGPSVSVTTTVPGQNAKVTFSGLANQRVSVNLTGSSYGNAVLKMLNPDGSLLSTALVFGTAGNFLEPRTLPIDGTYALLVDPTLLATGHVTVQVYTVPDDPTSAGATDGIARTLTTTKPGQNAYLSFTATAGQRVSLDLSGSTYGSAKVSVLRSDDSPVFAPATAISPLGTFVDPLVLGAGTYRVLIDPQLAAVGQVDVKLFDVPADVTGSITPGTPLTATTTAPGQNALFTFNGTINHRMSLNLTGVTFEKATVSILKPDGSPLFLPALLVMSTGGFREPTILPVTGAYKVKIDPVGAATGQLDVGLYDVPPDATASIPANATPVTISTTAPGQNAFLTFTISAARRVSLNLSSVTMASSSFGGLSLKILRPDLTTLTSTSLGTDGKFVDTQSLTQTGTYKIVLDPEKAVTGSATLTLYTVPADVTVPILANGTPTTVTVATPGQNAMLTFNGTANQRVAFQVSGLTTTAPRVWLEKVVPAGTPTTYVFFKQTVNVDPQWFDTKSLGATAGQFKIVLDPQGPSTGGATFKLWTVSPDVTGTVTPGTPFTATLGIGQNARLTFTATSGQTATITPTTGGTITGAWARLYDKNGTTQLDSSFWDNVSTGTAVSATLPVVGAPATGTYTFLLDPDAVAAGSKTFTLTLS